MCGAGSNLTRTIVDFSVPAVQTQIQYPQLLYWLDTPTLGLFALIATCCRICPSPSFYSEQTVCTVGMWAEQEPTMLCQIHHRPVFKSG